MSIFEEEVKKWLKRDEKRVKGKDFDELIGHCKFDSPCIPEYCPSKTLSEFSFMESDVKIKTRLRNERTQTRIGMKILNAHNHVRRREMSKFQRRKEIIRCEEKVIDEQILEYRQEEREHRADRQKRISKEESGGGIKMRNITRVRRKNGNSLGKLVKRKNRSITSIFGADKNSLQSLLDLLKDVSKETILDVRSTVSLESEVEQESKMEEEDIKNKITKNELTEEKKGENYRGNSKEMENKKKITKDVEEVCKVEFPLTLQEGVVTENNLKQPIENFQDEGAIIRESKVLHEGEVGELQEDKCFTSYPEEIVFKDFEIGKIYNRKLLVCNKTENWAYLRFGCIETRQPNPNVLQVELIDSAKVRPGLHVTMKITFSPVEDVYSTGNIVFLSLNKKNTKHFREFRVKVKCIPEMPKPIIEPAELRFPTMPIWRYNDVGYVRRNLIISNAGSKTFSFSINKNDSDDDIFSWDFENVEINSIKSTNQIDTDLKSETMEESSLNSSHHESPSEFSERENTERQTTLETCYNIIRTIVTDVTNTFAVDGKYHVNVPPKSSTQLSVKFVPRYVGLHHTVFEFEFEENEKVFEIKEVPVWCETTGLQIHIDPDFIDLGVILVDSGVYQEDFNVLNTGNTCVEVAAKTPKSFGGQVEVFPRGTFIQPGNKVTFSVRLVPGSRITNQRKEFFDDVLNIISIPIKIQLRSLENIDAPALSLRVLATVTSPHCLILEPHDLFLGSIHTQEAVIAEILLTNKSPMVQKFAFLDLPHFVCIQPNNGFGEILPLETIPLHLICSPHLRDMNGDDLETTGSARKIKFEIQAVTLTEVGGFCHRSISTMEKSRSQKLQISSFDNRHLSSHRGDNTYSSDLPIKNDILPHSINVIDEFSSLDREVNANSSPGNDFNHKDGRANKNVMNISAFIVDQYCELSEQIIEFPATPCGCSSMTSVELRGFNTASSPSCTCGLIKIQNKVFEASYKFKCPLQEVEVCPRQGSLVEFDKIKIVLIFTPKLPEQPFMNRSQVLKAERILDNLKEQKLLKRREEKPVIIEGRETEEINQVTRIDSTYEMVPGDVNLSEIVEPYVLTSRLSCFIEIRTKDGKKREEILHVKLSCPVIKPEIIILNSSHEFIFGPTAIGTRPKKILVVKNISNEKIKVNVTPLNPFGPFFVASGKTLESGSVLTLPITFAPQIEHQDKQHEFFEICGVGTRTKWRLEVTGSAAVPSWIITPEMVVSRLEAKPGKSADCRMTIQNTCSCPLIFKIRSIETLEGPMPVLVPNSDIDQKVKKKRKPQKTVKNPKIGFALTDEEDAALYGGKLEPQNNSEMFAFLNFDEKGELTVFPNEKVNFSIRFRAQKVNKSSSKHVDPKNRKKITKELEKGKGRSTNNVEEDNAEDDAKNTKKSTKSETKIEQIYHIGRFNLMLGDIVFVQELIMICVIKD